MNLNYESPEQRIERGARQVIHDMIHGTPAEPDSDVELQRRLMRARGYTVKVTPPGPSTPVLDLARYSIANENPQGNVRNALAILLGVDTNQRSEGPVALSREDFRAIRDRLLKAVEQLEGREQ